MSYHFFAMFLGFVLDLLFGDPHWLPHPIRLIGNLMASLEKLNKKELSDTKKFLRGFAMVVIVIAWTTGVAAVILEGAYGLHPAIGCAVEAIMTYQILATKCLKVESMKVYEQLIKKYNCEFDDRGAIGKRYRRQDEIGTPFCITYDFDSETDGCVTVRDRDTMKQERVAIADLKAYFEEKFDF